MGYIWGTLKQGRQKHLGRYPAEHQMGCALHLWYFCFQSPTMTWNLPHKLLFVLSLRSFGTIGDKDSQDDINTLWSSQMWNKGCICVSLWEVSDHVSMGNTRVDMILDNNTKDNTGVNQKLRPLLQGKEGRMTPRYFGEMLKHHLRGFAQGKAF